MSINIKTTNAMVLPINLLSQYGCFSDDELFTFCRMNPDLRIERDEDGQLFFGLPDGLEHSFFNASLMVEVGSWNRQTRLGRISDSNGGYTLPDTSMRAPGSGVGESRAFSCGTAG